MTHLEEEDFARLAAEREAREELAQALAGNVK